MSDDFAHDVVDMRPYRRLAAAVLGKACRDVVSQDPAIAAASAAWLRSDDHLLDLWCALADIAPSVVRARISGPRPRAQRRPATGTG